jgi:hypothetical protein
VRKGREERGGRGVIEDRRVGVERMRGDERG